MTENLGSNDESSEGIVAVKCEADDVSAKMMASARDEQGYSSIFKPFSSNEAA